MSAPGLTPTTAASLIRWQYGSVVGSADLAVAALPSYVDQNFEVSLGGAPRFVLKAANADESDAQLDAEAAVMTALSKADGLSRVTPRLVPTDAGELKVHVSLSDIQPDLPSTPKFWVRLITHLPGRPLAECTLTAELAHDVGRKLGRVDAALAPLELQATRRFLRWDLAAANSVQPVMPCIADVQRRRQVERHLAVFNKVVVPALAKVPLGLIHNDANDYNVLCDGDRVTGIVDFGDIVTTAVVCEAAVCLAYLLMNRDDPLLVAMQFLRGYVSVRRLSPAELRILLPLVATRLCVSVATSAFEVQRQPENREYLEVSAKGAWELLGKIDAMDETVALECFQLSCGYPVPNPSAQAAAAAKALDAVLPLVVPKEDKPHTIEEIVAFRREHCPRTLSISFKDSPLKITRGRGCWLYTETGEKYLDCVNNVCHVGHCHPRVVAAGRRQMELLNTNTRFLHDGLVDYSTALLGTLPGSLDTVFFVNSGTEANELALRLARTHTKRRHMVVCDHAYHGHTSGLIDISPYKYRDQGKRADPEGTSTISMPDPYRGRFTGEDAGRRYGDLLGEKLGELAAEGVEVAGFWAETLMGVGGNVVPPDGWLRGCYAHARARGVVCIADEVQVGFGRVGTHMWAFEAQGVVPDIVTLGKPIGNGHPMAAVVCRKEIASSFADTGVEYFATFGGNPVSMAIGLEVLRVIESEKLMQNALSTGDYFQAALRRLQSEDPGCSRVIGDVRGKGLFIGCELVADRATKEPWALASRVAADMKRAGVIITTDGPHDNVLKIKPPVVFDNSCVDMFCAALRASVAKFLAK
ncbi:Alanine--glyoxylate aminotransferase 2-like [Diplonema papillatum]|nr:Alanine--glyoxylate aminotransferase 2-like [Diplonema papillatum]